jgi:hypothetical protein
MELIKYVSEKVERGEKRLVQPCTICGTLLGYLNNGN